MKYSFVESPENNITRCYNLIYKNTLYMAFLSLNGHPSTLTFRYHIFEKYRNGLWGQSAIMYFLFSVAILLKGRFGKKKNKHFTAIVGNYYFFKIINFIISRLQP